MIPFVPWLKERKFRVENWWDYAAGRWELDGYMELLPIQEVVLNAAFTPDAQGRLPYTTLLYSTIKKSGKSTVAAAVGAWAADQFRPGSEIYVLSNDKDQAEQRVFKSIVYHVQKEVPDAYVTSDLIVFKNGTTIRVMATENVSAAGGAPALTLWDELWGFRCLVPGTRVLRSDLRWVPVEDLDVGDELLAFEEERQPGAAYRSYCRSTVVGTGLKIRPTFKVHLRNGEELTCTPEHKWLVRRLHGPHKVTWAKTSDLLPGDRIAKPLSVWDEPQTYEAGYIAAAYDGEGSLHHGETVRCRLDFTQKPNVMMQTLKLYLEQFGFRAYDTNKTRAVKSITLSMKSESLRLLGMIRPKRLLEKLDLGKLGRVTAHDWVEVVSVVPAGDQPVVQLGTSSKTYFAEGYCSHNSESDRRMWVEMGPVPTVPISIRFVSSYAGYESESHLLYDLYLRGVGKDEHPDGRGKAIPNDLDAPIWSQGRLFTYWDHEPRAPWQTDEYYAEQEADPTLRASDILRIHHNQWASSLETFIPSEWWATATKAQTRSAEIWADHPYRKAPVFVGVDVAPKHDTSAVVGVTYDAKLGKVVLLFHEIWNPKGIDLDLEATVEKYILDHAKRFNVRSVDYDPYQMLRSAKTLKNRLVPMREFPQTADNMVQASQCLYNLLKDNDLWAYPEPRAAQHVKNAAAVVTPRGARIVKDPRLRNNSNLAVRSSKPVDFAVALAMACYAAIELGDVDISRPLLIPSNTADLSTWAEVDLEQAWLPQPLRS